MSYAIIKIIYGVPLNEAVSQKIQEWEQIPETAEGGDLWFEDNDGTCGFETLYSASGSDLLGFCGVELCELAHYESEDVTKLKLLPTAKQKAEAEAKVAKLHPDLRKLAGPIGSYTVWSDS